MKTREELSEAELFHLATYEYAPVDEAWAEKSHAIGKKIAESLKPKPWKPSVKLYAFGAESYGQGGYSKRLLERNCHTKAEAQRRLKMERELNTINAYKLEANGMDAFKADWLNGNQRKFSPKFNKAANEWQVTSTAYFKETGVEVCSQETANKLCQLLNDGLIEGVAKRET